MKILYHHRIASKDGQYVHVDELTNAFKEKGHQLDMVAPGATGNSDFGSDGGFVSKLKSYLPKFVYELLELGYSLKAYSKLKKAIREHRPDVIYERYNLFMPAGIWASKKFKIPLISEINAPLYEERKKYNGIALDRLAKWSERYVWQNASLCLPVTQVLAEHVRRENVSDDRIDVIHNGINRARFSQRPGKEEAKSALGISPENTVLGFVGFIRDWHGLDAVIDMLAEMKNASLTLLVVGDGPVVAELKQQAARLGIAEQLVFTGLVQRDELVKYLAAFDIALQPAVVEYASPLKLFEYLELGCAIVAPDSANIREILQHEQNALLFRPGDNQAMALAIKKLCEDTGLRNRLGNAAEDTIEVQGYTWLSNAERVVSAIDILNKQNAFGADEISCPKSQITNNE